MADIADELWEHAYEVYDEGALDCLTGRAAAELSNLRAENERLREMADRLYSAIEYIDDYCLAYPELEFLSTVASSAIEHVDTRRNK